MVDNDHQPENRKAKNDIDRYCPNCRDCPESHQTKRRDQRYAHADQDAGKGRTATFILRGRRSNGVIRCRPVIALRRSHVTRRCPWQIIRRAIARIHC